jgi:uncharacterized linocin/CFP29 family protein
MDHLLRAVAPISDAVWDLLDSEARERLTPALAARKLVDFCGPHGWDHSATNLGRVAPVEPGGPQGVSVLARRVLPLIELRADFELSRAELGDADRGADDVDLSNLDRAAHDIASAENVAVLHGWEPAIRGISQASPHDLDALGTAAEHYPRAIAAAVERLLSNGIDGPYGLALGPEEYRRVIATAEHGGFPLLEHLSKIVEGPIVWAPGVSGAVVVSLRGGDFVFDSGQDLSIGYSSADETAVHLYLEESFSFHVATPEAAVALHP